MCKRHLTRHEYYSEVVIPVINMNNPMNKRIVGHEVFSGYINKTEGQKMIFVKEIMITKHRRTEEKHNISDTREYHKLLSRWRAE